MAESKLTRLNKVLREFNISLDRAVEYLSSKGHDIEARPTTKINGVSFTKAKNVFAIPGITNFRACGSITKMCIFQ